MEGSSSSPSLALYDFLDRMRSPASLDLVRSIKSFIVSFSFYAPNPENDGRRLQDFLLTMEDAIKVHRLWSGATEVEIDCALEGLEKYVMTKLFSRTFAVSPEDVKIDQDISEKISLLQNFLRPEHLDIPVVLHIEASWLLAGKELQKINSFKAPCEKLLCITNCCRVINNLLINASMSENRAFAGADNFLPVLIYITIKANPPQLHSNLSFIQLYRRHAKLVSEIAYYFTNLVSAKSFIVDLDGSSLSMDESEFHESMESAILAKTEMEPGLSTNTHYRGAKTESPPIRDEKAAFEYSPSTRTYNEEPISECFNYPFMEATAGELTIGDVERLLSLYKDVVSKYTRLYRTMGDVGLSKPESPQPHAQGPRGQQPKEISADANQEREQAQS